MCAAVLCGLLWFSSPQLLAVSTSKARLQLSANASFSDYLAAEYEQDGVIETLIDPLSPSGAGLLSGGGGGGSSSMQPGPNRRRRGGSADGNSAGGGYGGGNGEQEGDAYNDIVWGADAGSSGGGGRPGASGASSANGGAGTAGGRLLKARCWMARDFPMQLSALLPLLDVIGSTTNKQLGKVGRFLDKYSDMELFPVKLQVRA